MRSPLLLPLTRNVLTLARAEIAAIAALMVAALGGLAFVSVAEEVSEAEAHTFDWNVLLWMRVGGDPSQLAGPAWLHRVAEELTSFGNSTVLTVITLVVLGFLLIQRKWGAAVVVLVAIVGGMFLSEGLKDLFARDRPPAAYRVVEATSLSFPSGHAMLSATAYLTMGALLARILSRRRLKIYVMSVAALLALSVGLTRIYLGVHWTTDVIAGWSLGAAWAMACWLVAYAVQRIRTHSAVAPRDPAS